MNDLRARLQEIHERCVFKSKKHAYVVDGQPLVSVTTVLKETLSKGDGFHQWIANETYLTGEKFAWKSSAKREASFGTYVHAVAENWALRRCGLPEKPVESPSAEAQYLASGLPAWLDASGLQPILPEVRLYDLPWGVAGTTDLLAEWHDALVVVDFKSCKDGGSTYSEWALQVSAYARMAQKHTGLEWQGLVVRIPKSGEEPNILPLGIDDSAVRAFESLLTVYRWLKHEPAKAQIVSFPGASLGAHS